MKPMPKPLPCPCCGEAIKLYTGQIAAIMQGVICKACGLTMARTPNEAPRGYITLKAIQHQTLVEAIEAWNKRPDQPAPPQAAKGERMTRMRDFHERR